MVFLDNLITNVKQTSTNTLNYLKNGINSGVLKIENILDNDKKSIIRRKENFEKYSKILGKIVSSSRIITASLNVATDFFISNGQHIERYNQIGMFLNNILTSIDSPVIYTGILLTIAVTAFSALSKFKETLETDKTLIKISDNINKLIKLNTSDKIDYKNNFLNDCENQKNLVKYLNKEYTSILKELESNKILLKSLDTEVTHDIKNIDKKENLNKLNISIIKYKQLIEKTNEMLQKWENNSKKIFNQNYILKEFSISEKDINLLPLHEILQDIKNNFILSVVIDTSTKIIPDIIKKKFEYIIKRGEKITPNKYKGIEDNVEDKNFVQDLSLNINLIKYTPNAFKVFKYIKNNKNKIKDKSLELFNNKKEQIIYLFKESLKIANEKTLEIKDVSSQVSENLKNSYIALENILFSDIKVDENYNIVLINNQKIKLNLNNNLNNQNNLNNN